MMKGFLLCVYDAMFSEAECDEREIIMLIGDPFYFGGSLEVCVNGTFGGVCRDSWDINDARAACRQLYLPNLCKDIHLCVSISNLLSLNLYRSSQSVSPREIWIWHWTNAHVKLAMHW